MDDSLAGTVQAVPDRKPDRFVDDERTTLVRLLHFQRESFVRKVAGVSETDAASSPVPSGTTFLWLANHLADAEAIWVLHRFAGRERFPSPADHAATLHDAIARYERTWIEVDAVVGAASLDDLIPDAPDDPPTSLRWILAHLLEETARHAGHADILRELIDGSTGR